MEILEFVFDSEGTIFTLEDDGIYILTKNNHRILVLKNNNFSSLTCGPDDALYVIATDKKSILRIDPDTKITSAYGASSEEICYKKPNPPTDLVAKVLEPGNVELTWNDTNNRSACYEIYRQSPVIGAHFHFIHKTVVGSTYYRDNKNIVSGENQYSARAVMQFVSGKKMVSEWSNTAIVDVPKTEKER